MTPGHAPSSTFWRRQFLLHLLAFLLLSGWVGWQTRPISLPDLHLAEGERLACVSYAPYHKPGQSPFDPAMWIPKAQIAADLEALSKITKCVRIYAVDQGLEYVPELAGNYGLKVLLGAWIGRDPINNRFQIENVIRLANQYPENIRAVIVGNEVMLRREQPEAALLAMINEVKSQVKVPVTYADVWEFWIKHPSLVGGVDFLTIHILPYWEDYPIGVEHAIDHVGSIRAYMLKQFGKPVLIGETGWPSEGRQREEARPGIVEQARFVRTFIRKAHDESWDYNFIEAIDQPWKRLSEGTVGGYWGMLDTELEPKFPLQGPLQERASLMPYLLTALLGMLLTTFMAFKARKRSWHLLTWTTAGLWSGGMLWLGWEHALVAYRNPLEWTVLGAVALSGALLVLGLAAKNENSPITGFSEAWRQRRALAIPALRLGVLFSAATAAVLLLADPRYRDFPYALYALPVLGLLTLRGYSATGREERICAMLIGAGGIGRWLMEPMNPQAQAWLALSLLLAFAGFTRTSSDSTAPGAAKSQE